MGKKIKNRNAKRVDKEYLLSIKLHIVNEIERGSISINEARHTFGVPDNSMIKQWLKEYGNQFSDQF